MEQLADRLASPPGSAPPEVSDISVDVPEDPHRGGGTLPTVCVAALRPLSWVRQAIPNSRGDPRPCSLATILPATGFFSWSTLASEVWFFASSDGDAHTLKESGFTVVDAPKALTTDVVEAVVDPVGDPSCGETERELGQLGPASEQCESALDGLSADLAAPTDPAEPRALLLSGSDADQRQVFSRRCLRPPHCSVSRDNVFPQASRGDGNVLRAFQRACLVVSLCVSPSLSMFGCVCLFICVFGVLFSPLEWLCTAWHSQT